MAEMMEMAKQLGNQLARTDEYQALKRAISAADDDREMVELRNELEDLEGQIEAELRAGRQPDDDVRTEYEEKVSKLQANAAYQRLVAAQSNFDKIVRKVNETIMKGIEEGADSRIIISS